MHQPFIIDFHTTTSSIMLFVECHSLYIHGQQSFYDLISAYNLSKELISGTSHSRTFVIVAMTNCSIPWPVLPLQNNRILLWTFLGIDIFGSNGKSISGTCSKVNANVHTNGATTSDQVDYSKVTLFLASVLFAVCSLS
jgi:hypothetical protein